jgi:hypothetical protein
MGEITVTGLITYPIKSCAGIELRESRVTQKGLALDREFMLIDEDGDFLSQRKVPELALIAPSVGEGGLTVNAPGMDPLKIPLELEPDDTRLVTATLHGKPVTGQLLEESVSEWFSGFLPPYRGQSRFRVLQVRDDVPRYISDRYRREAASNRVGFADGSAMLLASVPSLAELNSRMADPVPMNRFRPNIIVDGPDLDPYEEDHWTELRIGGLRAFVTKPSDRCVTTDVDQATGVTGKAVRRALTARRGVNAYDESNSGVFFAQNLNHLYESGATVRVGDVVEVVARRATPNVVLRAGASRPGAAQSFTEGKLGVECVANIFRLYEASRAAPEGGCFRISHATLVMALGRRIEKLAPSLKKGVKAKTWPAGFTRQVLHGVGNRAEFGFSGIKGWGYLQVLNAQLTIETRELGLIELLRTQQLSSEVPYAGAASSAASARLTGRRLRQAQQRAHDDSLRRPWRAHAVRSRRRVPGRAAPSPRPGHSGGDVWPRRRAVRRCPGG